MIRGLQGALLAVAAAAVEPIPAEPPIDGPLWTMLLPALLLAVSVAATYLLYRHFAGSREGSS